MTIDEWIDAALASLPPLDDDTAKAAARIIAAPTLPTGGRAPDSSPADS